MIPFPVVSRPQQVQGYSSGLGLPAWDQSTESKPPSKRNSLRAGSSYPKKRPAVVADDSERQKPSKMRRSLDGDTTMAATVTGDGAPFDDSLASSQFIPQIAFDSILASQAAQSHYDSDSSDFSDLG